MIAKGWALFQRSLIHQFSYRSELLLWLFLDILPLIVLFFIWVHIYRFNGVESLHGFSLGQIITYYLIGMFINSLTAVHFEQFRATEIRRGKIDFFLTRPFHYFWEVFLSDLAHKVVFAGLFLPSFAVMCVAVNHYIPLLEHSFSLNTALLFPLLIIFGYAMEFSFGYLIVILSFWFEGAEGLEHFKWIIITILSGWMIPPSFMPIWLQNIVYLLPFKYMYSVPIQLIQGTATITLTDCLTMAITIILMAGVISFAWSKAQFRYASEGG
jgi:ABC-2 type transport system permease protein